MCNALKQTWQHERNFLLASQVRDLIIIFDRQPHLDHFLNCLLERLAHLAQILQDLQIIFACVRETREANGDRDVSRGLNPTHVAQLFQTRATLRLKPFQVTINLGPEDRAHILDELCHGGEQFLSLRVLVLCVCVSLNIVQTDKGFLPFS